ncbi:MAG: prephenate dehydrogenase [Acidobacteriota bacterium]|nr:prephenate dehydrogenase [Acidobacteriota bacterium]
MIQRALIVGTGLIGSSVGLALRDAGFAGEIAGLDPNPAELQTALARGAISRTVSDAAAADAQLIVLAGPVLSTLDWMERLAPVCGPGTLITDVGSTKLTIAQAAARLFPNAGPDGKTARFLPGHPMAGKESGGAALAEAALFRGAPWLFTPADASDAGLPAAHPLESEWRGWVTNFGARVLNLDAARHDEICAWVSHLPQMLSTALAALLEDTFAGDPEAREQIAAIGGRALRETTRLGASPYSMWRDVALTNTEPIAQTLSALEQRLAHLRENLRTPELREEFRLANHFRRRQ